MVSAISEILSDNLLSIYLYGSSVLDDFRLGWSDIDILVLTQKRISQAQAQELVTLRQSLLENTPENPYYCLFEGGMLTLSAFRSKEPDCVIARGIYTLRNGTVASKTDAAQWVLDNNLCPVFNALKVALKVRKNPMAYRNDTEILNYAETLGADIQHFADVLEKEFIR